AFDQMLLAFDQMLLAFDQMFLALDQTLLAFDQMFLALDQTLLALDEKVLTVEDCVMDLLDLEMLLPTAQVKLGESILVHTIPFSQEPDHLVARLAAGEGTESSDQRHLQIREARPHLSEPGGQVLVQGLKGHTVGGTFGHGLVAPSIER